MHTSLSRWRVNRGNCSTFNGKGNYFSFSAYHSVWHRHHQYLPNCKSLARRAVIRLIIYLFARNLEILVHCRERLLYLPQNLGFVINKVKSVLISSQKYQFSAVPDKISVSHLNAPTLESDWHLSEPSRFTETSSSIKNAYPRHLGNSRLQCELYSSAATLQIHPNASIEGAARASESSDSLGRLCRSFSGGSTICMPWTENPYRQAIQT